MILLFVLMAITGISGFATVIAMLVAEERVYRMIIREIRKNRDENGIYDPGHTKNKEELTADSHEEP